MKAPRSLSFLLTLSLLALAGCAGDPPLVDLSEGPPPVVIIALDTIRADHIGAYGADTKTPNLDRIAAEGILFEDFSGSAPWTLPSFGSAFTGRWPSHHRAVGGPHLLLNRRTPTLGEWLSVHGYTGAAHVSVDYLGREFGITRGFQQLVDNSHKPINERSEAYGSRLHRFLNSRPAQPWFLLAHYFEAHAPYLPPTPFDEMYYQGQDPRGREHAGLEFLQGPENRIQNPPQQLYRWLYEQQITDPVWPSAQYRAGISHVDAQVGKFLLMLEREELLDKIILVVLGDHGEHLGEHSIWYTHRFPYQEALHVPMMIRLPKGLKGGTRVATPSSVVDLLPTLADLLDLPLEFPQDGRSLVPDIRGKKAPDRRLFAEYGAETDELVRAMWDAQWRLIHFGAEGRIELYDRSKDRAETRDLASEHPELIEEWLEEMHRILPEGKTVVGHADEDGRALSKEVEERLRALGYID